MSDATNQVLEQAHALIESDRLDEAEALLKPVLAEDPDNVDAWWVYVHAVKDVETARMALNTVLKLQPAYPGAQDLLNTLEEQFPSSTVVPAEVVTGGVKRIAPPTTLPDLPEDDDIDAPFDLDSGVISPLDDDVVVEDKFAQAERKLQAAQAAAAQRRRISPLWLAVGAMIAVVLIALFLVLRGGQVNQATPTATLVGQIVFPTISPAADSTAQVAVDLTEDLSTPIVIETEVVTEEVTLEGITAEPDATSDVSGNVPVASTPAADIEIEAVETALSGFETVAGSTGKQVTLLGSTLLTDVCSAPDTITLRDTLYSSMNAMASASTSASDETQALGVRLVNCATGEVLRVIAAPLESAVSFTSGSIDEVAFQAQWVAVA